MILNTVITGSGKITPVTFNYTGQYSTEDDGTNYIITFITSGVLTIENLPESDVSVYLLAGGGGAALACSDGYYASYSTGGGGGNETYSTTIKSGTYPIVVGAGGSGYKPGNISQGKGGDGGDTSAFGFTVTGGRGGQVGARNTDQIVAGAGGSPNGGSGNANWNYGNYTYNGGSPNGGSIVSTDSGDHDSNNYYLTPYAGGDGCVKLSWQYPKPYIGF
ncbi:MAG: glycine-rich domain-containing protein [Christensenellales bacterium]